MVMLAEDVEFVIGVDTHLDTHSYAVVDRVGGVRSRGKHDTTPRDLRRMVEVVKHDAPGRRLWAIEQSGSWGAGLVMVLEEMGEQVVEIDRPARPARRNGAKDDDLDAVRAAREALSRTHLSTPRARGRRAALRMLVAARRAVVQDRSASINHLKSLVVTAPPAIREQLRGMKTPQLVATCSSLRMHDRYDDERRGTVLAMRTTAKRIQFLFDQTDELEEEIERLVRIECPELLDIAGVGLVTAAQVLVSWSHAGRVRSEAAFAAMAGVAPIPASSGQTVRHRLNRSGDRQLNRALHNIVLARIRSDAETQAYVARRQAEGRTIREIRRCLKRSVARQLFRFLEAQARLEPLDSQ
jgi:transposase